MDTMSKNILLQYIQLINKYLKKESKELPETNETKLISADAIVGKNLIINGNINLKNINGKIIIGDDVVINCGAEYNSAGGEGSTYITIQKDGILKIGNKVGMSNVVIDVWQSITIEDKVAIGACCIIRDNDAHSLNVEDRFDPSRNAENTKRAPVLIKEGAFIGMRSIILKGVTIGKESVIGAGSVVTKSVPDREIWAGNPAKFIRKL